MNEGYYSREELAGFGFRKIGKEVQISRLARVFRPERISIGNYVRIDDFCVLSGNIYIGNHVMMTVGVKIMGGVSTIKIGDFVGFAYQTVVVGEADDYSGRFLFGPTVPSEYRCVHGQLVNIGAYSLFGANCTVLSDVNIAEGSAFGAMTLVNKDTEPWGIYVGVPAKRIKDRKKDLIVFGEALSSVE